MIARRRKNMVATITTLTDDTFDEEVGASPEPLVVDFWAAWCGPCKMLEPVLEELAAEHAGRIRFAKLNVDEELETTRKMDVMSMPTLIVFRDGVPVKRLVGARGKASLREELEEIVG
jgi:thioredoxin